MRMHQLGAAAVAVAAMAVLSASGPLPSRVPTHLPLRAQPAPVRLSVTVPAQSSLHDLAPTEAAALTRVDATVPFVAVRRAKLVRPPRRGPVGSSPPAGTPQAVLAAAYRKAVSGASPGCHLQVAHLAAVGQVESGSIGGRSVTADHRVTPAIYGLLLDGGPFAVIRDSDGGALDGASDFDRAMGPLQFLPGTWRWAGRDGDGDGRRDPQNVFDAAAATGDYLCRDGRNLARPGDLRTAVLAYNQSGAYHSAVLEWVSYFQRHGLAALTTVAFRVGSGGRASAMTAPVPEPIPPTTPAPSTEPTKAPNPAAGVRGGGPAAPTPTTPTTSTAPPTTGTPTTPVPPPPEDPSPVPTDPTLPAPSPTTTTPEPAGPAPVGPGPSPTTGVGSSTP